MIGVEAVELSQRLRTVLNRGLLFEQALYTVATPADIENLESLIGLANRLGSEPMSEDERKVRKYIQDCQRPA